MYSGFNFIYKTTPYMKSYLTWRKLEKKNEFATQ